MKKIILSLVSVALMAILVFGLVSCAPADAQKAKAKLEEKGYEVEIHTDFLDEADMELGMNELLIAYKGNDLLTADQYVSVYFYEKSSQAKDAYKKDKSETTATDTFVTGVSGKLYYIASSQAEVDDLLK